MRKLLFLAFIVIFSQIAMSETIKEAAIREAKYNETDMNVIAIYTFIQDNIKYQYHYSPQAVSYTWKTKQGDCTDRAILGCKMLGILNYECRLAHGYDYNGVKHDWFEWKQDGKWYSVEGYKRIGYGVW
jgi:transglutaminase-like putative cysteine protease